MLIGGKSQGRAMNNEGWLDWPLASCIVDGEPYHAKDLPEGVKFVGMEKDPNKPPRYGVLYHPWFNKPCYETEAYCLTAPAGSSKE